MDRAVLGPTAPGLIHAPANAAAEAYRTLQQRHVSRAAAQAGTQTDGGTIARASSQGTGAANRIENSAASERSLGLGERALKRGDVGVARLHFRMAAHYGSQIARDRLEQLENAPAPAIGSASAGRP
jgi:hypothetical protein